jgi:hypothetical protein
LGASFREILQYSNFINNQERGASFSFVVIMYIIHNDTPKPKMFNPKRITDHIFDNQWMVGSPVANKTKLRGRSPQANYTDRETAACRQS